MYVSTQKLPQIFLYMSTTCCDSFKSFGEVGKKFFISNFYDSEISAHKFLPHFLKMFRERSWKRNEKVTVPAAEKELKKGTVPVFWKGTSYLNDSLKKRNVWIPVSHFLPSMHLIQKMVGDCVEKGLNVAIRILPRSLFSSVPFEKRNCSFTIPFLYRSSKSLL